MVDHVSSPQRFPLNHATRLIRSQPEPNLINLISHPRELAEVAASVAVVVSFFKKRPTRLLVAQLASFKAIYLAQFGNVDDDGDDDT